LQKTIGFALVERLFAQFLVGVLAFERRVAERPEERMVGNQAVQCKPDMMTEAGPLVVLRGRDQLRAHGRHFDDARGEQKVTFALDDRGTIAPFPKRAASRVTAIEVRDVTTSDCLHRFGQAGLVAWRDKQMHRLRHQRIGMDGEVMIT
jgi:hypothetical protein